MMTFQRMVKRATDFSVAVVGLVLASPLLMLTALAVRVSMGRPVFFRQERPGLNGRPFAIYKFRTMRDIREDEDPALTDGERLTPLGRFLRASSLDELPELWNVLKGDLSLVGPRPLLMRYLPYFTPREAQRHSVRPGITGWAQIHGRNEASWEERFENDLWYIEHWSLALDWRILLMTLCQVVSRRGVVVNPSSTMKNLDEQRANRAHCPVTRECSCHADR